MKKSLLLSLIACMTAGSLYAAPATLEQWNSEAIRHYPGNKFYWEYKGNFTLLVGGSWQDNLFNHPTNLEEHLTILSQSGGNYLRNVMSHRNQGNEFAYHRLSGGPDNGEYDLSRWNDAYWNRFDTFLKLCYERDIIVQLEIWATWDLYGGHQSHGGWSKHPFNPIRNVNYTAQESGLPTSYDPGPGGPSNHAFFKTVPSLENNTFVLEYQKAFVDKVLSISLKYPNVLYTMNNETGEVLSWGHFWVHYVSQKAAAAGKKGFVTDMRRGQDTNSPEHIAIISDPANYDFIDISQINGHDSPHGDRHYNKIKFAYDLLAKDAASVRPINCNKMYAWANEGIHHAFDRFARLFFGGVAAARHHRPHPEENPAEHLRLTDFGLGLSPWAQVSIRSIRMLSDEIHFPSLKPDHSFSLLPGRQSSHETYAMSSDDKSQYLVLVQSGSPQSVSLDLSQSPVSSLELKWLDVFDNSWTEATTISAGGTVTLQTPGNTKASTSPGGKSVWVAYIAHNDGTQPITYTLSTTVSGEGTVTRSPDATRYSSGAVVTLTATPASGWVFSGWSGAVSATDNPATVTMSTHRTVNATFSQEDEPGTQMLTISGATAGAEEGSNLVGNAYDGNTSTRWANDGTVANAWIQFDLGTARNVSSIKLMLFNGATRTYPLRIEVGDDSFTQVWSGQTSLNGGYQTISFPAESGRYVRVTMTGPNSAGGESGGWFSIYDCEIWGPQPATIYIGAGSSGEHRIESNWSLQTLTNAIMLNSPVEKSITVTLYDMKGRGQTLFNGKTTSGQQVVSRSFVPSGQYVVVVRDLSGSKLLHRSLIVGN